MSAYEDSNPFEANTVLKQPRSSSQRCCIVIGVVVAVIVIAAVVVGVVFAVMPKAQPVVTAVSPPMGWNSWNKFQCDGFTELIVRQTMEKLLSEGLARLGYKYIVLDDCWQYRRSPTGHIQPDPIRFPNGGEGMRNLVSDIHFKFKGLKLGLHTSIGSLTCQRRPGSHGLEELDAKQYASWGIDYVKAADCYLFPGSYAYSSYIDMSQALKNNGRNMVFAVGPTISTQGAKDIANSRQVVHYNVDDFDIMLSIVDRFNEDRLAQEAGSGFWNDLGPLQVGNGKMSNNEYHVHLSLWSALKSPLFLGNDIRTMSFAIKQMISNPDMVAINQDPLGKSAQLIYTNAPIDAISHAQIISRVCASSALSQQFKYDSISKTISQDSQPERKCLTIEPEYGYITLRPCQVSTPDPNQQWFIDTTTGQIHHDSARGNCITTSTILKSPSKLRSCTVRNQTALYTGPNKWWHPWNDAFFIDGDLTMSFSIGNTNNMCADVGAVEDIQIYSGPLVDNNLVAVMVNRDVKPREITLRWQDMGVSTGQQYQTRDVWSRQYAGDYTYSYTTTVPPHDVRMLHMTAV